MDPTLSSVSNEDAARKAGEEWGHWVADQHLVSALLIVLLLVFLVTRAILRIPRRIQNIFKDRVRKKDELLRELRRLEDLRNAEIARKEEVARQAQVRHEQAKHAEIARVAEKEQKRRQEKIGVMRQAALDDAARAAIFQVTAESSVPGYHLKELGWVSCDCEKRSDAEAELRLLAANKFRSSAVLAKISSHMATTRDRASRRDMGSRRLRGHSAFRA